MFKKTMRGIYKSDSYCLLYGYIATPLLNKRWRYLFIFLIKTVEVFIYFIELVLSSYGYSVTPLTKQTVEVYLIYFLPLRIIYLYFDSLNFLDLFCIVLAVSLGNSRVSSLIG